MRQLPARYKLLLAVLAAALVWALTNFTNLSAATFRLIEWIRGTGVWAPLVFIGIYIVATVLVVPGTLLTLAAGVLFGVWKGALITSVAATTGATAAFLVGRYFARDWVERTLADNPKFHAIDDAIAEGGWKIVGLLRLSPIFPFNIINYLLGVTRVTLRDYVAATFICMAPATTMFVWIGALAGDLAVLASGERTRPPAEWALYIIGFIATVAVTLYITRLARRALRKRTTAKSEAPANGGA